MSSYLPAPGLVQSIAGTAITSAYAASSTVFAIGACRRVRFYVESNIAGGSSITTVTVKVQYRYNDYAESPIVTNWADLPSNLDVITTPTLEIDHAFTITAGSTVLQGFYVAEPSGLIDCRVAVKANTTGNVADVVRVFAVS